MKPFTRILKFWPVKRKKIRSKAGTTWIAYYESRCQVCTWTSLQLKHWKGSFDFFDDESGTLYDKISGLLRFGGADLFEFRWCVLLVSFSFSVFTVRTFPVDVATHVRAYGHFRSMSSDCKQEKLSIRCLLFNHSITPQQMGTLAPESRKVGQLIEFCTSCNKNFRGWFEETTYWRYFYSQFIRADTDKFMLLSFFVEPVIETEHCSLFPKSLNWNKRPGILHVQEHFWNYLTQNWFPF